MLHANIYILKCAPSGNLTKAFKFLVGGFSRKINIQLWHLLPKSMPFEHAIGPSQNMNISSIFPGIKR